MIDLLAELRKMDDVILGILEDGIRSGQTPIEIRRRIKVAISPTFEHIAERNLELANQAVKDQFTIERLQSVIDAGHCSTHVAEWKPTRWWRAVGPDEVWCESSDEAEVRALARPEDRIEHLWQTVSVSEWRPAAGEET